MTKVWGGGGGVGGENMKPDGGLTFLVIEGGPKFAEGPQTQF